MILARETLARVQQLVAQRVEFVYVGQARADRDGASVVITETAQVPPLERAVDQLPGLAGDLNVAGFWHALPPCER